MISIGDAILLICTTMFAVLALGSFFKLARIVDETQDLIEEILRHNGVIPEEVNGNRSEKES